MDAAEAARAVAALQDAAPDARLAALDACGPLADADIAAFSTEVLPFVLRLAVAATAPAAAAPCDLRVRLLHTIEQVCSVLALPSTPPRIRYPVLAECIEAAAAFLADETIAVRKRFILAMTNMFPVAFRILAETPGDPKYWTVLSIIQIQIDGFFMHPNEGIKTNAAKYLAQVVIVQLPRDELDSDTIPSLSVVPANHPYMNSQKLMSDAGTLMNKFVAFLGASNQFLPSASFLTSIINCIHDICKARAQSAVPLLTMLLEWHRQPPIYLSPPQLKSVMRIVKVVFLSLYATQAVSPIRDVIGEALMALGARSHELQTRLRREAIRRRAAQTPKFSSEAEAEAWRRSRTASGDFSEAAAAEAAADVDAEAEGEADAEAETAANATYGAMIDGGEVHTAAAPVTALQLLDAGIERIPLPLIVDVIMRTLADRAPAQWMQDVMSFLSPSSAATQPTAPAAIAISQPQSQPQVPPQSMEQNQVHENSTNNMQEYAAAVIDQIQNQLAFAAQQQMGIYGILTGKPHSEGHVEGKNDQTVDAADRMHVPVPLVDVDAVLSNPPELSLDDRQTMLAETIDRILSMEHLFSITTAAGAMPPSLIPPNNSGVLSARLGWMILVSRITTRSGTHANDIREVLLHFVLCDFAKRVDLAVQWLHEEFLLEETRKDSSYTPWFHRTVDQLVDMIRSGKSSLLSDAEEQDIADQGGDSKEQDQSRNDVVAVRRALPGPFLRAVTKLFLDVPLLTDYAFDCIAALCESVTTTQLGITTLRKLITARPNSRDRTLKLLLGYTIFPDIPVRSAAIGAIRRFFPEHKAVSAVIETYAAGLIEKLVNIRRFEGDTVVSSTTTTTKDHVTTSKVASATNTASEVLPGRDGLDSDDRGAKRMRLENVTIGATSESPSDTVNNGVQGKVSSEPTSDAVPLASAPLSSSAVVPEAAALVSLDENTQDEVMWTETDVIRHLELYFVLCSRKHDVFDIITRLYPRFPPFVQRIVQARISGLLRAMSSNPAKLLDVISTFPTGAEDFAIKILHVLERTEHAKAAIDRAISVYIARSLDIRFLLVIMPHLDRAQLFRELPKLVGSLDGTESTRDVVRSMFLRLVQAPQAESATDNEVRKAILAPAELLIWIHQMEDVIGVKRCLEATSICFSLPDIFKQEVLAVVLQQLSDLARLPTLLMRTAMQSLSANKGLLGFVVNLLLKLISKQVWTNALLWEGFIRCCTITFPSSIPILMVLPKPQSLELISRSPKLVGDVRQYIDTLQPHQRARRDIAALMHLMSEARV